jgi:serine/threonine-protein kinase
MIGQTISHYTIIEKIGAGGMGVLFKAHDQKLDRIVALKFLPPSFSTDEEIKKRFVYEARAASKLQHNNICTIHEISETGDGQLFICMDYYDGMSLKEKLDKGKLELNEALDIIIQICEGLKNAHEKNIIHRDIKPANIFITNDGIVKILDFGLAKVKGETQLTRIGSTVGTVSYMSPEQAKGEDVDQRTDIWSLGVLFYQMVSGNLPFKGDYDQAIIYSILNKTPDELNTIKKIRDFIFKCLEKKPKDRYQSIDQILVEFHLVSSDSLKHKILVKNKSIFPRVKKNKMLFGFVILILLLLAAAWFIYKDLYENPENEKEKQVAVLPFLNIGDNPSNQAFCDGLVETLTSELTQLKEFNGSIQVIPSNEIRFRKVASAKDARQIFGADLAVTGSIQKFSNRIRLIINLVDTKSLRQVNSSVSDYSLTNVYKFQDKVVSRLSSMMEIDLKPDELQKINYGETNNQDAYIFYTQGRGYLQNYWDLKNVDNAINLFHQALSKDPEYAFAFAGLGEAYIQKFRNDKNVKWLDSALIFSKHAEKINGNLPVVLVTSGMIFNESGRYEEAAAEFEKAIEKDRFNFDAYNGLALSYQHLNLNDRAEETYRKSISIKPSFWVGYNKLGIFFYSRGNYDEALVQFKKVVELTPDNTFGLNNAGAVYMSLEKWPEAVSTFKHIIALKPSYSAYSNLGSIYFFHEQNYKEAARMYEEALKLDSTNYLLWGNVAAAYYQIPEKKTESTYYFKNAISLGGKELQKNPRDAEVLSSLSSFYSMLGDKNKAVENITRALRFSADDNDVIERAVITYEVLGMRDQALKFSEKILSKGFPVSKLENSPDLKNLVKDKRFEKLVLKYSKSSREK